MTRKFLAGLSNHIGQIAQRQRPLGWSTKQAQRWAEVPEARADAGSMLFVRADKVKAAGSLVTIPALAVQKRTWYEYDVRFDCAAQTISTPKASVRLRWDGKDNGSVLDTTLPFAKWPEYAGLGQRVCGGQPAQALAGLRQHNGDPKKNAWAVIDAEIARYPGRVARELTGEVGNLTLAVSGAKFRIATVKVDACWFDVTTVEGKKARLKTTVSSLNIRRRAIDFSGDGGFAQIAGLSEALTTRLKPLMSELFFACTK